MTYRLFSRPSVYSPAAYLMVQSICPDNYTLYTNPYHSCLCFPPLPVGHRVQVVWVTTTMPECWPLCVVLDRVAASWRCRLRRPSKRRWCTTRWEWIRNQNGAEPQNSCPWRQQHFTCETHSGLLRAPANNYLMLWLWKSANVFL